MTSTEIVRREPNATLPEKMEWARALATSNLLPRQYQNNPGNLLFAVEYADALGVSRINAITSIHVIEGKPSASADLIASLVRRAGHKLRVEGDDTYAEAVIIRADDPDYVPKPVRWDMNKARVAGLTGKGPWKAYPGAMLRSRAITEACRMWASDALFGVIYTPEELGAEVDAEGDVVHQVTTARAGSGADRAREALGVAEPVEDEPAEGITSAQTRKMGVAMRDAGLTDRAAALAYVADVISRPVSSRNELTKDEASRVIDALEHDLQTGQGGRDAEGSRGAAAASVGGNGEETAAARDGAVSSHPDGDVVEAELVDDPEELVDDPDPEGVWAEIVRVAGELGMTLPDVQDDVATYLGGTTAGEASGAELQGFLDDNLLPRLTKAAS